MKKINLIYWDSDNLGDILSPYIVEEISGIKTQHKNPNIPPFTVLKIIVKSLITLSFKEFKTIIWPWQTTYMGIGSILDWANNRSIVWGSGFMNKNNVCVAKEICAVRGNYTLESLKKFNFKKKPAFGDPALLLPLMLSPATNQEYRIGIVPHWKEVDYFIENYSDRFKIIDLRTRDVPNTIAAICSCKYILSTSLHGLIIGHAYGISSLWIKKGFIDTDGFKFHDYFSSVGIPIYDGFGDLTIILKDVDVAERFCEENKDKAFIRVSLKELQTGLLKSAPFPLKPKYIEYNR